MKNYKTKQTYFMKIKQYTLRESMLAVSTLRTHRQQHRRQEPTPKNTGMDVPVLQIITIHQLQRIIQFFTKFDNEAFSSAPSF